MNPLRNNSGSNLPMGNDNDLNEKTSLSLEDAESNSKKMEEELKQEPVDQKNKSEEELKKKEEELKKKEEELKKLQQQNVEFRKKITGLIDSEGNLIDETSFSQSITNKVKGIYNSVSVKQIDDYTYAGDLHPTPSRKIELNRFWCFMDMFPIVAFSSSLFVKDSIYRKTINENLICKFILDGEVVIDPKQLDEISNVAEEKTKNNMMNISNKYKVMAEDFIHRKDFAFESKSEDESLIYYLSEYKKKYDEIYGNGKESVRAAFWQSKSVIIHIPNKTSHLSSMELTTAGIINPIAIKVGSDIRVFFQTINKDKKNKVTNE
jgi:hypothetical protein